MTSYILILYIITFHRNSLDIWTREEIIAHKSEFVSGVDGDPIPDIVTSEDVATGSEQSVDGVIVRFDVERNHHLVDVSRHLYRRSSHAAHLADQMELRGLTFGYDTLLKFILPSK